MADAGTNLGPGQMLTVLGAMFQLEDRGVASLRRAFIQNIGVKATHVPAEWPGDPLAWLSHMIGEPAAQGVFNWSRHYAITVPDTPEVELEGQLVLFKSLCWPPKPRRQITLVGL